MSNTTSNWRIVSPQRTLVLMLAIATAQHRAATAYANVTDRPVVGGVDVDEIVALCERATVCAWNSAYCSASSADSSLPTPTIDHLRKRAHSQRIEATVNLNEARKLTRKLVGLGARS